MILTIIILFIASCVFSENKSDSRYNKELIEELVKARNEDSPQILLKRFVDEKDEVGQMLIYKNLRTILRLKSRFSEAISNH